MYVSNEHKAFSFDLETNFSSLNHFCYGYILMYYIIITSFHPYFTIYMRRNEDSLIVWLFQALSITIHKFSKKCQEIEEFSCIRSSN